MTKDEQTSGLSLAHGQAIIEIIKPTIDMKYPDDFTAIEDVWTQLFEYLKSNNLTESGIFKALNDKTIMFNAVRYAQDSKITEGVFNGAKSDLSSFFDSISSLYGSRDNKPE